MLIGMRNAMMATSNSNKEEEMYKEMFRAVVCNVPNGETVRLYDPDITYVGPYFLYNRGWNASGQNNDSGFIEIDFPNVVQCGTGGLGASFYNCRLKSVNLPSLVHCYGGANFQSHFCTEINLPLLQNIANHEFSYSATLKTLNLPSLTSKSGSFFVYQCSALEHVYIPQMTLSQLGGASYIAQQSCNSAAVFHLKDGDYDYQGNLISNGGYKRKCVRRSHRRSWRPSARFYAPRLWKEVA